MRVFVEHGQGTGIVDRGGLALVASGPSDPVVRLLATLVAEPGASIAALVDGLVELGVHDLTSFGVVLFGASESSVMVRGSVIATAKTSDGTLNRYDASRVSTWVEDSVDIAGVVLSLRDDVTELVDYWVRSGVVPAMAVRWGVEADRADAIDAGQPAQMEVSAPAITDEDVVSVSGPNGVSVPESSREHPPETDREAEVIAEVAEPAPEPLAAFSGSDETPAYDFTHLVDHTVYRSPGDAVVEPEDDAESEVSDDGDLEEALTPDAVPVQPTVAPDHTQAYSEVIDAVPADPAADVAEEMVPQVVESPDPSPDDIGVDGQQLGDHDGFTVARRKKAAESEPTDVDDGNESGVHLAGVRCPSGHGNNPIADQCVVCGAEIVDHEPVQVERPALGRLRLPNGEQMAVASPIVMGRNPVAVGLIRDEVPRDLVVDDELVSRNHAQLIVEGWNVLISDLHSTNQTTIVLPGQTPRVVSAEESILIIFGTEIFLGDYGPIIYEADF